jgi:hypothetical protein
MLYGAARSPGLIRKAPGAIRNKQLLHSIALAVMLPSRDRELAFGAIVLAGYCPPRLMISPSSNPRPRLIMRCEAKFSKLLSRTPKTRISGKPRRSLPIV